MLDTKKSVTRKLKHDINKKNEIRGGVERRIKTIRLWKVKLKGSNCFQKQKRYTASIKRYIKEIERLRAKLNSMNEDLDKRIREVGEYSTSELEAFTSQLDQEIKTVDVEGKSEKKKSSSGEVKNARKNLAELKGEKELQKKIEKANKLLKENIEEIEQITGKIVKLDYHLRKISEVSKSDKNELSPEEKDKNLFTQELKRITRDRAIYS
jgi:valyl-tRNA synthetase